MWGGKHTTWFAVESYYNHALPLRWGPGPARLRRRRWRRRHGSTVLGCRLESGRVRSWGHLTTPFFLASFSYHQVSPWWCSLRYAVQGEARRGCCRSPMKPWSLGRAHPIVMMVIMPLFCTHSIPADFSAKRTCWPLLQARLGREPPQHISCRVGRRYDGLGGSGSILLLKRWLCKFDFVTHRAQQAERRS